MEDPNGPQMFRGPQNSSSATKTLASPMRRNPSAVVIGAIANVGTKLFEH
jgi:hypothetical protein